ncbi:hypothetical protein [Croceivirga radicis]|uniref:hypothetical protein n=1 Tax=Croceivirga radicis TaxID=1929488 RepID=UPI000255B6E2|nr:hypothetical protein [Croceivirga radicis]
MKNLIVYLTLFLTVMVTAQEMPITYSFGEKYNDRHRYSNLVTIAEDGDNGYILVRSYFQGLILKPKGYLIERYDKDLNLISEYNYKFRDMQFIDGFVKNGTLNLIFFNYDYNKGQYEYWVHKTATTNMNFTTERFYSIETKVVEGAYGKNYYNRNFNNGFSTTLLFNRDRTGFVISTDHAKGKEENHTLHMFDTSFKKRWEVDFDTEAEEKNYAFEQLALSDDLSEAYLIGKAYFKKRRFKVDERKYQYELMKVGPTGIQTQDFTQPGIYPEALYPILEGNVVKCVGFYADRKDNRYNGISFYEVDKNALALTNQKHHPFTEDFMFDKFGREDNRVIKNLVFKGVDITEEGNILFNAEEYFVTNSMYRTGAGQRMQVERFHYNDIMSAKLKANGDLIWVRNVNKSEVTQGDEAYASYSSFSKDGTTYFFICTAAENPQLINNERMIFKQGLTQNRNVFTISLDAQGKMTYKKIIDGKEARLPLMVSMPFTSKKDDAMLFYAKRGSKKQLVKVAF